MNLQTLISYKEFCFLGRTRAATNGPDESRRKEVTRRFPANGWVPARIGANGDSRVTEKARSARGSLRQTPRACLVVPFPLPYI